MLKTTIAACALAAGILVALFVANHALRQTLNPGKPSANPTLPSTTLANGEPISEAHQGFIFGRVTANDDVVYEGRLRFGGDEEAFWGDYFNGLKNENPWATHMPVNQLRERRPLRIFGVDLFQWERQIDLTRPFMSRFGDIVRIEGSGRDLRITLKSGTTVHLDRFAADDFADGVRVWSVEHGIVDLDERQIHSIDFLAARSPAASPDHLHGTVSTRSGNFTGFIQWNREKGDVSDELRGNTADGELRLRFDTVRSIARNSSGSSLVTQLDGKRIVLSGTPEVGPENRGLYVDDRRYGRVLIPWDAFERVDFDAGGDGPAYGDFPAGSPLKGEVTTHDGRRLTGRLVYDLDESETTETLDAPSQGIDYTILFGLIASIALPASPWPTSEHATVTLHNGEVLELELAGDLGAGNTGVLIFTSEGGKPETVIWAEISQIHFDRPPAMYPPLERR